MTTSASASPRATRGLALLGLAGSLLVAYAAPGAVADSVVGWWYQPSAPAGRSASLVLVYIGMGALCCAWLALGRALPSPRGLLVICALWAAPLVVAPPLFSRDIYSYLAQGTILHLGHSPYLITPNSLPALGRQHVLAAVSEFWRGTTAPYGPLFLDLISGIVGIVGTHLVAGALLTRGLGLIGLTLLAASLPRLTRALGTDARRALWLGLLSPVVMLELIVPGHNDLLMAGLLAAGVACALGGAPLAGIAICALAATVKLPALAGVVFIAVAWGRAERTRARQLRFLATAGSVTLAILGAVTLATGVGVTWISSSLLSTPAKVHLAITPVTAVGYTAASLLRDVGIATSSRGFENTLGIVGIIVAAAIGLVLVYRVRIRTLVADLGALLLIAAALGPAAWPWYGIWGLALIAAVRAVQRSSAAAAAIVLSVFVVKPNGILALPVQASPAVVIVYTLIGVAWYRARRRGGGRDAAGPGEGGSAAAGSSPVPQPTSDALAGT